jgi:Protein of unknown function (DUF3365)
MNIPVTASPSLVVLAGLAFAVASSGADVRMTFVDPAAPEAAAIRQAGEAATAAVAGRLITELTAALAHGGPEQAVEVCHVRAQPLTRETPPGHPQVTALKRTSLRLRNPVNAPDAAERAALDHVASLVARGEPAPALLVQKIDLPGTPAPEWRVYRSVFIQPACLACHGSPEAQSPALRALLRERYPQDAATGYKIGDWRGFLRTTVRPP